MIELPIVVKMSVDTSPSEYTLKLETNSFTYGVKCETAIMPAITPIYEGDYEVTPTDRIQILATEGKLMMSDVVINPIPSNYGLIGWNGSVLTVS